LILFFFFRLGGNIRQKAIGLCCCVFNLTGRQSVIIFQGQYIAKQQTTWWTWLMVALRCVVDGTDGRASMTLHSTTNDKTIAYS